MPTSGNTLCNACQSSDEVMQWDLVCLPLDSMMIPWWPKVRWSCRPIIGQLHLTDRKRPNQMAVCNQFDCCGWRGALDFAFLAGLCLHLVPLCLSWWSWPSWPYSCHWNQTEITLCHFPQELSGVNLVGLWYPYWYLAMSVWWELRQAWWLS